MADIKTAFKELDSKLKAFKEAWAIEFKDRWQSKYYPGHGYRDGDLHDACDYQLLSDGILFFNDMDYASHVEFGTVNMAPQGQLRSTAMEADQVTEVAKQECDLP